jgi:hypothetical protein
MSKLGVGFGGGASNRFAAAAGVGPNPNTTSQLWVWYMSHSSIIGANRGAFGISNGAAGTTDFLCRTNSAGPKSNLQVNGVLVATVNNQNLGVVQPQACIYDRTGSRAIYYNGQEKLVGTFAAGVIDGNKGLGDLVTATNSMSGQIAYGFMFSGAPGEMSDANLKAMLQALGFTIPW